METVISVEKLSKKFKIRREQGIIKGLFNPNYKTVQAVEKISFTINRGEAVAFLGPNGAGKTTTTKMLTGLMFPSEGYVKVLGFTPFERQKEFLKRIGLVMGNRVGLNWDLTPRQSFALLRSVYEVPENVFHTRLQEFVTLLEVEAHLDTQLRRLSLGERMKMELIGSILHSPEVLFLDEPTIGLDIVTKKTIREFLKSIQKEHSTTLILTSHDMDDIEHVCERVIVINQGKKVYDDSLQSLNDQYKHFRYVRFLLEEENTAISQMGEVVQQEGSSYLFKVASAEMVSFITQVLTAYSVQDVQIQPVPLEEIITELFHKS